MTEKYQIEITLPLSQHYAKEWWIDQMIAWCLSNNIDYIMNAWPYANGPTEGYTSKWSFKNSEDAALFGIRWKDNDWGPMHHPV